MCLCHAIRLSFSAHPSRVVSQASEAFDDLNLQLGFVVARNAQRIGNG
jgi:hypothetical protein